MAKYRLITRASKSIGIAAAIDLIVWRAVIVHPAFHRFPIFIQLAILAHEEGHLALGHVRKRLWWALNGLWWRDPAELIKRLHEQEYEADAYAAERGLSNFLIEFLLKCKDHANKVRPNSTDRIARLRGEHEFSRCVSTGGQDPRH